MLSGVTLFCQKKNVKQNIIYEYSAAAAAASKYDAIKQDNNTKYEINQVTRWPQPDHTNQKEQNYHDYHDYDITHLNCILFFIWIVCKDRIGGFVHT